MAPDEYNRLTPAETYARIKGFISHRDGMVANFRALFTVMYNQYAKDAKTASELWPIPSIDKSLEVEELEENEMYERNKRVIEQYNKKHGL